MKTKHTPGKWRIKTPLEVAPENCSATIATCRESHAADCDLATAEANAKLIAAAPELLAACQAMQTIVASLPNDYRKHCLKELDLARTAIKQATE